MPDVTYCSATTSSEGPDLGEIIEPLQSYFLSCNPEANKFTDPSTYSECVEIIEIFSGTALRSGYDAWTYVDFS